MKVNSRALQPIGDFLVKKMTLRGYGDVQVQQYETEHGTRTVGFYDKNGVKRMFLSQNAIAELKHSGPETKVIEFDLNRIELRPSPRHEILL